MPSTITHARLEFANSESAKVREADAMSRINDAVSSACINNNSSISCISVSDKKHIYIPQVEINCIYGAITLPYIHGCQTHTEHP